MNILFVCTGNTCRSPMAEGLVKGIAEKENKNIVALSAGLFTAPGARVSPEAVNAVKDLGGSDISAHLSRPLEIAYVEAADVVLAMTEDHKKILLRQFPFDQHKIFTLGEWAGKAIEEGDVADPFGQSQEVYNSTAKQIYDYLEAGLSTHEITD